MRHETSALTFRYLICFPSDIIFLWDQTTKRTTVAYGFVNAQVDIKEKILIQETDTGDVKEQQVVVKPEDFNEDDMKAIYLLCEYTAVQRLKNFFFH